MRKKVKSKKLSLPRITKADRIAWRDKFKDTDRGTFDDLQKDTFLRIFALQGRFYQACAAVNQRPTLVKKHLQEDDEFEEAFQQCRGIYQDHIQEQAYKLAVTGVAKPIIGGKFKDEVVAHEMVYATNILAMEMKRTNKEYNEKSQIAVDVKAGVLLVPAGMSLEEWEKQHGT